MKLLAHNDGRELRGNERQLLLLANELKTRGHDLLVSSRLEAPLQAELGKCGVRTTPIRPRGDLDVLAAWAFRGLVRCEQPDAVLLTSWKRVLTASWAARRANAKRVVVRLGIVRAWPARKRAAWRLRQAFENFVDVLVVNSSDVAATWMETAPWFPRERLRVILNAVAPAAGTAGRIRSELQLDTSVRLVASVGTLEQRKGVDLLLRALTRLPDVHAVFAGNGPDASSLRALASVLGLDGRVYWLGQRSDVPDVLADSDAFVLPSRQDSIANALLEAMSAGLPVVATEGNGVADAIAPRDGRAGAGWIVRPEDPAAIAAGLEQALGPDARIQGDEARWRTQHWFSPARMADEYEQVLFR
ncbi:MAG: glycosyltransferase family 4 protein [Gemmatimonadota bacterium]